MKTVIVLAMHGVPANDFPRQELAELFSLHGRLAGAKERDEGLLKRYRELEKRVRQWPRNGSNDPFYTASQELAWQLKEFTCCEVIVGFNEFCAPALSDALQEAADKQHPTRQASPVRGRRTLNRILSIWSVQYGSMGNILGRIMLTSSPGVMRKRPRKTT